MSTEKFKTLSRHEVRTLNAARVKLWNDATLVEHYRLVGSLTRVFSGLENQSEFKMYSAALVVIKRELSERGQQCD